MTTDRMHAMEAAIPGRQVPPDLRYNSKLVEKFINYVTRRGKKALARRIVYTTFEVLEDRTGQKALDGFYKAIENCAPRLETRSRRVGGSAYQVPYEVPEDRRITLAMRWIVQAAKERSERSMAERLAAEILDATQSQGKAYEKKLEAHRMAEANRAFAHYRW